MQAVTEFGTTEKHDQKISQGFFFSISFLIWLGATLILRFWGHTFFIPDNNLSMISSFLFFLVGLPPLVYGLFQWQQVPPDQRRDAAMYLAIPSIFLDAVSIYFFAQVFPNMSPAVASPMAAWLFWGYGIILVTGWVTSRWDQS